MTVKVKKYHIILSEYYENKSLYLDTEKRQPNTRKLVELPWQQTKAELWDEAVADLCSLYFIQAKCIAGMVYNLINDFILLINNIPEQLEQNKKINENNDLLDGYNKCLLEYSNGQRKHLDIIKSIEPWSNESNESEIERRVNQTTRLELLMEIFRFLGHQAEYLQAFSKSFPNFIFQQASNYVVNGPIFNAIEKMPLKEINDILFLHKTGKPKWNPLPSFVRVLRAHPEMVENICISHDSRFIYSLYKDGTLIKYNFKTGQLVYKNQIDETVDVARKLGEKVLSVSADGKFICLGQDNNEFCLWDSNTGKLLKRIKCTSQEANNIINCISITPNAGYAICGMKNNNSVFLYDINYGRLISSLEGHKGPVNSIAISADCKIGISGSIDKSIIVWDLIAHKQIFQLTGHYGSVRSVAMTPDAKYAISGSDDKTIIVWDLLKGTSINILKGHTLGINSVRITPDGKKAISGGAESIIIYWDLSRGTAVKKIEGHKFLISAVDISSDARYAASASQDKDIIIWDLEKGNSITEIKEGHTSYLKKIITLNDKMVLSLAQDNHAIIWDLKFGKPITKFFVLEGIDTAGYGKYNMAVSSDMRFVICNTGFITTLWNIINNRALKVLSRDKTKLRKQMDQIKITPDNSLALYVYNSKSLFVWSFQNKLEPLSLLEIDGNQLINFVITPDGKNAIVSSIGSSTTIMFWDLEKKSLIKKHEISFVKEFTSGIAITPDGKNILLGGNQNNEHNLLIFEVQSGKLVKKFECVQAIRRIFITICGRYALTWMNNNDLALWDLRANKQLWILHRSYSIITSSSIQFILEITPDCSRILTTQSDNILILFDLISGEKIACYPVPTTIEALSIFSDGVFVGASGKGETFILNMKRKSLCPNPGIVTVRYLWNFSTHSFVGTLADCPFCKARFEPPKQVLIALKKIEKIVRLNENQSPCLEIPDQYWDEPELISNCPTCGEKLKFNPFIVDNSERKWWKF